MSKPCHLLCLVDSKHQGTVDVVVEINRDTWDSLTPAQRSQHMWKGITDELSGRIYGYTVAAEQQGSFIRSYRPGSESFDLTIVEMDAEGMLDYEWELRGYLSEAEMMCNHYGFDDWEEAANDQS